jgi:hypothetical protein
VKKYVEFRAQFPYFRQFRRTRLTELPVPIFDDLGVSRKLMMSSSDCHKSHVESSLGPLSIPENFPFLFRMGNGEESYLNPYMASLRNVYVLCVWV